MHSGFCIQFLNTNWNRLIVCWYNEFGIFVCNSEWMCNVCHTEKRNTQFTRVWCIPLAPGSKLGFNIYLSSHFWCINWMNLMDIRYEASSINRQRCLISYWIYEKRFGLFVMWLQYCVAHHTFCHTLNL